MDEEAQRLLLEVGLLHQPMGPPGVRGRYGARRLVAARPQPDVIGQDEPPPVLRPRATAPPAAGRRRPFITVVPLAVLVSDDAEEAAPMRRLVVGAFEARASPDGGRPGSVEPGIERVPRSRANQTKKSFRPTPHQIDQYDKTRHSWL